MTRRAGLALILTAVALLSITVPAYAERCVVDLVLLNRHRRVPGPVEVECQRPSWHDLAEWFHSAPFGNWGVLFKVHPDRKKEEERRDGYQFSGWKARDGWLQWNSCTTRREFAPGDPRYYNDNGFRSQRASPDIVNASHSINGYGLEPMAGVTCEDLYPGKRIEVGNVKIEVYELDVPGDDRVATLGSAQK
jgi:hypothetical protein